jgi:uncharacterized membrane protein YczE
MKNIKKRFVLYLLGLFIIALGIAMAAKSDLGVTPTSSIPYAISQVTGWEFGLMTALFHFSMVVFQALLQRKRFPVKSLLQVPVGLLFGSFVTMATNLLDLLPTPGTMAMRVLIAVVGSGVIGLGIFFYLPANIVPLAPDAAMAAVAEACGKPTGPTKVVFDIANVIVALILCLSVMGSLGSVGIGTVISALLLGTYLGFYNRRFGHLRDKFLNG